MPSSDHGATPTGRAGPVRTVVIYRFCGLELDTDRFELRHAGTDVALEPQVFDVLVALVEHRDRVVTKEELLDRVWGDRFVSESALTSRIKDARRAVGDDGRRQAVIKTVHGRGYRFVADVTEQVEGSASVSAPVRPLRHRGPVAPTPPPAPRTHYVRSGGYSIAYQVFGEGPGDLVFLPGFVSNVDLNWEHPTVAAFFARLATFRRVVVLDKRGTGVSERVPEDRLPTLEERVDDVRAVMDAAGCERAAVLGSSEGGPMSLLLAATHPERVERLVIHNSFSHDPFEDPARIAADVREFWGTGTVIGALAPSWSDDRDTRRFLARYERQSASPNAAAALIGLAAATDASAALGSVTAPTLVVHRRDDPWIRIDRGRALAATIPSAELVELDGTDHLAFADAGTFLDTVERFVTGAVAAPAPERMLTTMLFVDIVGSTETASRLGDARWRAVLADFRAAGGREIERARGEQIGTTGDGLLAVFDGPARAVRAGLALRGAVAPLGLEVRAGVHTAEVERLGDDLAGIGVHAAARVADLAPAGEVWVTRTVKDLVVGSGLDFEPRGAHELRGVPDSWELFAGRDRPVQPRTGTSGSPSE